jgi:signal transduction histidine kinase
VHVEPAADALQLTVVDDGAGGAHFGGGSGLLGLKDRVEALGGTITLESSAENGTTVSVSLPVAAEVAA